jgi:preprotein translocase subunit SecB
MNPALQLIGHRLADLELHASTDPSADGPIRLDTELIWDHPDPTGDEWRLALTTRFGTENEQKPAPYSGKVQIIGRFQIDPKLAKTAATRLVHDDGAEILFAATRELLIQLTSRSLHGEFVLPGVSFVGGNQSAKGYPHAAAP